jgi:hypothetical protein
MEGNRDTGGEEENDAAAATEKVSNKADAEAKQAFLTTQLNEANKKSDIAASKSDDTKQRLGDTQVTLGETKLDLSRQGDLNLITALANSDQTVADIELLIPLTAQGNRSATFHGSLLSQPPDYRKAFRALSQATAEAELAAMEIRCWFFAKVQLTPNATVRHQYLFISTPASAFN